MDAGDPNVSVPPPIASAGEAGWRRPSRLQWRSGLAAWLGWTFDGLDMHLYTLVAAPFVAQLLGGLETTDARVGRYSSDYPGGFPAGLGPGRRLLRPARRPPRTARALSLTVLTYAAFTGLSFFARTWWHLLAFRFLAALGIGGEWAVGASLLSETWPRRWRPWVAAVLQTGVNVGILMAGLANYLPGSRSPAMPVPGRDPPGFARVLGPPGRARTRGMAPGPGSTPRTTSRESANCSAAKSGA